MLWQVRLYNGLKFVRSRSGSEAAKRKGLGHWLILDPVAKVGGMGWETLVRRLSGSVQKQGDTLETCTSCTIDI